MIRNGKTKNNNENIFYIYIMLFSGLSLYLKVHKSMVVRKLIMNEY